MSEKNYFQQPLIQRYALGIEAIRRVSHNPENSILVSLTERELCSILLGLMVTTRLFPEVSEAIEELTIKLNEVGGAQKRFGLRFDGG